MMSIFLTEELTRHTADSNTSDLVFFFCGAGDENRNTAVNLLRGLVHQILEKRPQLIVHALAYFKPPERARQTLSSLEALWLIFSKLVTDDRLGTIFCVLDGLDECEEGMTQSLLQRILDLLVVQCSNYAESLFKLAIVNRDIPVLRGCTTVKLDPDNNQEIETDISTFVRSRIQGLFWIHGFEHIQEPVQAALPRSAEGTFLWVGFAVHELLQMCTCKQIRETLQSLPSGLPTIYGRMLLRIPPNQRASTRTLLQWIALAARPLRLPELAAAIYDADDWTQMETEQATRDLVTLCGSRLKTARPNDNDGLEVSLVHQSGRDYLLRSDRDSNAVLETFRFDKTSIHLHLAQRCLSCVESKILHCKSPILFSGDSELSRSTLLGYAAYYWPYHAKQSALAISLFESHDFFRPDGKALREAWWRCCKRDIEYTIGRIRHYLDEFQAPPLPHMVCMLGLMPLIEVVLRQQAWRPRMHRRINKKYIGDSTPLHVAALQNDLAILRLLLQKGADSSVKDWSGRTPLEAACETGNEAAVRLLLEKGAEPTSRSPNFDTLLHRASEGGSEAVVQLLLDLGASPTAQDSKKSTALHLAARFGREVVLQLLLNVGANIEAQDAHDERPLHSASDSGDKATVQLLLDRGANFEAQDSFGKIALHFASRCWNTAVVELLIGSGADVTANGASGTPLHRAAYSKRAEIAKLLFDKGANVEAKSASGHTPLHEAVNYQRLSYRGDQMIQLLLDRGAGINAEDGTGHTALFKAVANLHEAEVRHLLDRGADTKTQNLSGHRLLYEAAKPNQKWRQDEQSEIMRLLIARGVDVEELEIGKKKQHTETAKGSSENEQTLGSLENEQDYTLVLGLASHIYSYLSPLNIDHNQSPYPLPTLCPKLQCPPASPTTPSQTPTATASFPSFPTTSLLALSAHILALSKSPTALAANALCP